MPVRLPGTDTLFDHQETPVYPLVDQISCIIHHYCGMLKTIYVTCPLLTLMCVVRKPSFDPLYSQTSIIRSAKDRRNPFE